MRRPSVEHTSASIRRDACAVAQCLRRAGHEAWLVGGLVRDLALERDPKDVDIATDATPDRIEQLFPRTKGVGRAFGTMLVLEGAGVIQLTTFRSEHGYSDARRPDRVEFGHTVEEDARRRDFTCNALYLDPLTDELRDPQGGLADLAAGSLRCVGDACERFREDGLRLIRLARFAAALDLEVDGVTLDAARQCRDSIAGVSGERLAGELTAIFERPRSAHALELLDSIGVYERALPDLARLAGRATRWRALAVLEEPVGALAGFAVLADPTLGAARDTPAIQCSQLALAPLRLSRELCEGLREVWGLVGTLAAFAATGAGSRAERVRAFRRRTWPTALHVARAFLVARDTSPAALDALAAQAAGLSAEALRPPAWITAQDLEQAGVPRGPRWGELLLEAETHQLDGLWSTRDEALAWLAERSR